MSKIYSSSHVATHNSKQDCWVTVNGLVLELTHYMQDHPGGELAIVNFAGKDATVEFNMFHRQAQGIVNKLAPYTIVGKLSRGDSFKAKLGSTSSGCFAFLGSICGQ
mmetsp:Transcript_52622/g.114922  ORF Transcript_52622/g.114922 Transcript_52622/m.114922 type:complete len:107 (-) Transcript_52622:523-843(-)|eukprot:CAMPEP_0206446802 /NCGR_PEP_ID=MMETSP0324_2-20121206/16364_1 /ASSEMBLY_ACC=CAM_ASM_000836 /TAXON_ID=2866 /ORGANISM="Crypthecodinium cohnii, Strain Seligo" /LENGTH=106 /DNA_ID=CAMNT_0053915365 /DNA_START=61 /DNA_END=381 /DNA_ORIENTATION=+